MRNLPEYREERLAPRVPRSGGHDPFRFRKRVTDHGQKMRARIEWKRHAPQEYRAASLRKLMLGRLPGRAAKYGCADFDLSDTCEYAGDDGQAAKGQDLAGIAAHIVRCAKHPVDYLFSLRTVPAKWVEPIKAYLRVKLAIGRLETEIEAAHLASLDNSSLSSRSSEARVSVCPANTETSRGQQSVDGHGPLNATVSSPEHGSYEVPAYAVCQQTAHRDDRCIKLPDIVIDTFPPPHGGGGGPELLEQNLRVGGDYVLPLDSKSQLQDEIAPIERSAPTSPASRGRSVSQAHLSFTWHTSPAKTHNFKELTKRCGYDPRETSVYWIEKRASALRRKWKKHSQIMRGETPSPRPITLPKPAPLTDENHAPKIKHFKPKDIDYNSVWPPLKLPVGPPKVAVPRMEEVLEKQKPARRQTNPASLNPLMARPWSWPVKNIEPMGPELCSLENQYKMLKNNTLFSASLLETKSIPRSVSAAQTCPLTSAQPRIEDLLSSQGNFKPWAVKSPMMITGTYDFTGHVQALRRAVYGKFGWDYRDVTPAPPAMLPMQAWGIIASSSGMFHCRGDLSGQAYGGQDFDLVDVYAKRTEIPGEAGVELPGFRGVIGSLAYPQGFAGRTIIRNDLGTFNPKQVEGMKRVGMVDLNFERQFEVYADDQVQARALITPDFMERLMAFSTHYLGRGVQCVFLGSHLHVALNIEDRFRFSHTFQAFDFKEAADILIAEVGAVCLLLEQMQTLQASIGRLGASGADKARQIYYRDRLEALITAVSGMEESWQAVETLPERLRDTHYYFCDSLKGLLYPRF